MEKCRDCEIQRVINKGGEPSLSLLNLKNKELGTFPDLECLHCIEGKRREEMRIMGEKRRKGNPPDVNPKDFARRRGDNLSKKRRGLRK